MASNLGVVELTVALHFCFNTPTDKIIWDVGHQSYVHKILTGRRDGFGRLRKLNGLSGFPKGSESVHDAFDTGHSSTSISAAMGYCVTRDLEKDDYSVIAVIGDGSITGGLAYEAMNNAGRANTNIIVILNDNEMSISRNVGAISRHLNDVRIAPYYLEAKADVSRLLEKVPLIGGGVSRMLEKTKDTVKYFFVPGILFEEMGFKYVGPIDGHDTAELVRVLKTVKKMNGPVLIHVRTKKGKGYVAAENAPTAFHGVDSFNIDTGKPIKVKLWDTYSDVFGKALVALARENKKILALTAAMPGGTGLTGFERMFPNRIFDVGIAEAHAVTFAAGIAKNGYVPVFAVYSSFLQRSYDQILHDVCIQNLHVVFAIDRAGITGSDGETHQGLFDLSFLSHMPNMTVMAPKNKTELKKMLAFAVGFDGPIAIRYPKGAASRVLKAVDNEIVYGKAEVIDEGEGKRIAIVSVGSMADKAYEVYLRLREDGFAPMFVNARFVKPIDRELAARLDGYEYVFVCEDNVASGGFGEGLLAEMTALGARCGRFHGFAVQDTFVQQGSQDELFRLYGLDVDGMYGMIREIF